jgi:hypothetical protein
VCSAGGEGTIHMYGLGLCKKIQLLALVYTRVANVNECKLLLLPYVLLVIASNSVIPALMPLHAVGNSF